MIWLFKQRGLCILLFVVLFIVNSVFHVLVYSSFEICTHSHIRNHIITSLEIKYPSYSQPSKSSCRYVCVYIYIDAPSWKQTSWSLWLILWSYMYLRFLSNLLMLFLFSWRYIYINSWILRTESFIHKSQYSVFGWCIYVVSCYYVGWWS